VAINLGDINFGLGPDTRRLDAARRAVLQFGQAVNRAAQDQSEGARKAEAALRRQEAAILSALQTTLKLNQAIRNSGANDRLIQSTTMTFNRLVRELGKGQVSALQFQRSMEDFQASTGRVNRQLNEFNAKQRQAAAAQREAAKAAKEQEQYTLKLERALFSAQQQVDRFNAAVARIKAPASLAAGATSNLQNLRSQLASGVLNPVEFQRAMQQFQQGMQRNKDLLKEFQQKTHWSGLEGALRRASDMAVLLHGPLSGIATRLTLISSLSERVNFTTAAMVTGLSAGAYTFLKVSQGAIDAAKQIERVTQAMQSLTGSAALTQNELAYVMEVSDRAGSAFATTAQQFVRLTAAAKGTNLEGEQTRIIFENMLFAAQKLGSSNDELAGSLRAIEQIISKGQVQAEELRGQLGDRLPGAVQIMAQALGVTTQELNKMMKQGQLTSDVLVKFSDTVVKRLGIDVTKSINTVIAAENRLNNAWLRFNKAADDTIGFSSAYVNALNGITSAFDYLGKNMDSVVTGIGAVSGAIVGALTAIYAPAIISGFTSLITIIRSLTAAMLAFNAAAMSNPLGAIATLLARVGLAAAGAVGGFKLMEAAISGTNQAHFGALAGVEAYIKAQKEMGSTIRATTQEYIKQQEVMLASTRSRMTELTKLIAQEEENFFSDAAPGIPRFMGVMIGQEQAMKAASQRISQYQTELKNLGVTAETVEGNIKELNEILNRQTKEEEARRKAVASGMLSGGSGDGSNRTALAIKNAKDTIRELNQAYEILQMPKWQQQFAQIQLEINKSVEDFRDRLTKAKVPMSEVTTLTEQYAEALRRVKEGQYNMQHSVSWMETFAGVVGRGLDDAMNSFVDSILEGKDAFQELSNIGKQVIADLIKGFMQLAILNPLKNALFGGNPATGSPFPTLAGGFFGNLFAGIYHSGGVAGGSGAKRSVSASAFIGAPRYHSGGIAGLSPDEVPAILQKGETIIPRGGVAGGSGGSVNIVIQEAPGTATEIQATEGLNGIDIQAIVVNTWLNDMRKGGPMRQSLRTMGVTPFPGR